MVTILKNKRGSQKKFLKSGSLIHPSVVLTSANFSSTPKINNSSIIVRAADWNIRSDTESYPYQQSNVESIVIHEDYHRDSLWNDMALLFLETPFIISTNVNLICLPSQDQSFDNSRCIVTGWRKIGTGNTGKFQGVINHFEVPIVSHRQCQESLHATEMLHPNYRLHESFICAGGERGKGACRRDAGSSLICPVTNNEAYYYQAGIVLWRVGCGVEGVPEVYVKVSNFRNWIDGKLNERGFGTDSYTV